jgi:spore germination protein KC
MTKKPGTGKTSLRTLWTMLLGKKRTEKRRILLLLLLMLLVLNISGCWSRRELNTLAIVLGTALDAGPAPDTLTLTAQVVKAGELKSGSSSSSPGGGAPAKAYANIQGSDKSVLSLLRGLTHKLSRRLYFSHNQVLIFSSELAQKDIAEGLDGFMRDYETRLNVYILISRGRAADILDEDSELEKLPATHIANTLKNQSVNSETVVVTLRDFAIAMLSGSTAPVTPIIDLLDVNGKKRINVEGTAVFKQGKMIGELSKDQTRGMMWVTNKAQGGVTTVDTQWGQVVLEITQVHSGLKPVKTQEGGIRMSLDISVDGFIESNETTEDMSKPENVQMLKGKMMDFIHADVQNALNQARSLRADVFGFGDEIRRSYPALWESMKENWDEVFPTITLDVTVRAELRSTGGLTKPLVPGGGSK